MFSSIFTAVHKESLLPELKYLMPYAVKKTTSVLKIIQKPGEIIVTFPNIGHTPRLQLRGSGELLPTANG